MKKLLLALFIVVVVATWYASLLAAPSIDFNYEVIDDALEDIDIDWQQGVFNGVEPIYSFFFALVGFKIDEPVSCSRC